MWFRCLYIRLKIYIYLYIYISLSVKMKRDTRRQKRVIISSKFSIIVTSRCNVFWIYDFMLILFDNPEICGIHTILVEGRRNMFGDNGHTSISKYDDVRRYLSKHYLTLDL